MWWSGAAETAAGLEPELELEPAGAGVAAVVEAVAAAVGEEAVVESSAVRRRREKAAIMRRFECRDFSVSPVDMK